MKLKVKVSKASLDDVVAGTYDHLGGEVSDVTLGDVVVEALMARLAADPRWDGIAERFWEAVEVYMRHEAPGAVLNLVRDEVARQLESPAQGAVTRGQPSTRAQAIVATEVTSQLRDQFGPAVQRALDGLDRALDAVVREEVAAFRGRRQG